MTKNVRRIKMLGEDLDSRECSDFFEHTDNEKASILLEYIEKYNEFSKPIFEIVRDDNTLSKIYIIRDEGDYFKFDDKINVSMFSDDDFCTNLECDFSCSTLNYSDIGKMFEKIYKTLEKGLILNLFERLNMLS